MVNNRINKDLLLRSKTDGDFEFVHKTHDEAYYDAIVAQFGDWDQDIEDGFFDDIWKHPNLQVIEYLGKMCGFFCMEDRENEIFINEIVLSPTFQGRGIGSAILGHLKTLSADEGKPLTLEVLKSNNRARLLYKRFGFELTGDNPTHIQMRYIAR
jgi:ribosomal protein S18 acetylase RimI-like enzyme